MKFTSSKFMLFASAALLLAACGGSDDTSYDDSQVSGADTASDDVTTGDTTGVDDAVSDDMDTSGTMAGLPYEIAGSEYFTQHSKNSMIETSDMGYASVSGSTEGDGEIGFGDGLAFEIPAEIEGLVAGETINITVNSRGGPMQVSYFTMGAGNSGWQTYEGSEEWTENEFTYTVSADNNSGGDILAIIPVDLASVEVMQVTIDIADPAPVE